MPNPEDSVLDDIDRLVDWQLSGDDRSDSFHGEQFRENEPCPWCNEGWHFLPITETMRDMRCGSYARDEFGAGIVDPDYDYRKDTSPVLCPGSEFLGPRDKWGTWDKQSRERAQKGSSGAASPFYTQDPIIPSFPAGQQRYVRFIGPFRGWTIAFEDERIIEGIYSSPALVGLSGAPRRIPLVIEHRLMAVFEYEYTVDNPSLDWIQANLNDVGGMEVDGDGQHYRMKPVSFPFRSYTIHASSREQEYPDYIELLTTYEIERHPWILPFFQLSPQSPRGAEADCVIIDEAYEFSEGEMECRLQPPNADASD